MPSTLLGRAFRLNRSAKQSAMSALLARHRAMVAEDIAVAIEASMCEPGEGCVRRFCPDCVRYAQCQADAATARRIGEKP